MSYTFLRLLAGSMAALIGAAPTLADPADLAELGIDQLMQMEITSASKKQQKLAETASAIYALSHDDIRRSGATSLPELLQMVPGVEAAVINDHTYAIGIRGLNGQWNNKLLVLIDGRSVYTRTFSGVYWDSHNIPLEDIERIEVIRGANAALWGANAVNGVINIITKNSAATQGTLLRTTLGTHGNRDALARHGSALGDNGHGRVYVSGERHGNSAGLGGGSVEDAWKSVRAGARGDWEFASGTRLMAQAETYRIESDNPKFDGADALATLLPIGSFIDPESNVEGHSLHVALTRAYGLTSEWTAQLSLGRVDRDEFLGMAEDNIDLDFQHRFQPLEHHDLVWGMNARYRRDHTTPTAFIGLDPIDASDVNASLFFHDEISLANDRFRLAIGTRFEHDEHNKWEVQPSLRGLWNLGDNQKLWAAVSRAARTPSRVDRDLMVNLPLPFAIPEFNLAQLAVALRGDKAFKTETMLSYELGYRLRPTPTTSLDLALFHNRYDDLRTLGFGGIRPGPAGLIIDIPLRNTLEGEVWGGELVVNWAPNNQWRLELFWSEQRQTFRDQGFTFGLPPEAMAGSSPERQIGFRSDWDITAAWSANLQLKYVGALPNRFNPVMLGGGIGSYVDADLTVSWRPTPQLSLALLGKNLLDKSRLEFSSETGGSPAAIRRAAYLRATWNF